MFKIDVATAQDIPAVDALFARSYPSLLKHDYAPSMLVLALPRISRAQPALISSGTYYLVRRNDAVVGAGGWTIAAPGDGQIKRGVGHIRHVATDPDATRQGVGRALMAHIIDHTKNQGLRYLECLSTRTAVPFYEAMGFAVRAKVTVPLAPGIDFPSVEMTCDL